MEQHLDAVVRIDRDTDLSGSPEPLVELLTISLLDAVGESRGRYLAIIELQLEARRRPTLAAAFARLADGSVLATAQEHDALGFHTSPETLAALVTLYSGALFTLVSTVSTVSTVSAVSAGGTVSTGGTADAGYVRGIARAIVRGAGQTLGGQQTAEGPRTASP